jgi:DNA-binding NtrC family response regulator
MLWLVARHEATTIRLPVLAGRSRLGSSAENDLVIQIEGVSRRHALVDFDGMRVLLSDLQSKNGVRVRGKRVSEVVLEPGRKVQLGYAEVTIEEGRSSDARLAIARVAGSAERDESTTVFQSDRPASAVSALAFIREIESWGPRLTRSRMARLMDGGAEILGCESLIAFSLQGEDAMTIEAHRGTLPDEAFLFWSAAVSSEAERDGHKVLVARRDSDVVTAVFVTCDAVDDWKAALFVYIAGRLRRLQLEAPEKAGAVARREMKPSRIIVGESPIMRALMRRVYAAIDSTADVLLTGETGTGKELFARMIHETGPTGSGPFVTVNCAAINAELAEAELFGVLRHVATGVDPRPGLFVSANRGSIFLDEIGDLSLPLQAKLLRVVQEREVMPVGSHRPRPVELRIIAASNRDLALAVDEGAFRADLYHRLRRGLIYNLPALRDRREDILALVDAFVETEARAQRKEIRGVSRKAYELLQNHSWPGNIRELEGEVARAVRECPNGSALQSGHLALLRTNVEGVAPGERSATTVASLALEDRVAAAERQAIEQALATTHGNKSAAARLLRITRNGLALKMRRLRMR